MWCSSGIGAWPPFVCFIHIRPWWYSAEIWHRISFVCRWQSTVFVLLLYKPIPFGLPIKARIIFKIVLYVYKCLHDMAPAYLSDHINFVNHGKSLRSKDLGVLYVPRSRINTGDRAFSICGPRIWNKLPIHIQKAPTLEAFKKKLKTYLFLTITM